MKNILILIAMALFVVGCSSKQALVEEPPKTIALPDVKDRPEWVMSEPLLEGDVFYFTGVSSLYATEKFARRDAKRDALFSGMEYLSTVAKAKYEQAELGFGLEGATLAPTVGSRGYYKFVHMNVLKGARSTKWYFERELDMVGRPGYKYFALVAMPKKHFFEAYSNTAKANVLKAQQEAADAVTEVAKEQARQNVEFWKIVEEEGLNEDDFFKIDSSVAGQ
jgi:hypothetical protein